MKVVGDVISGQNEDYPGPHPRKFWKLVAHVFLEQIKTAHFVTAAAEDNANSYKRNIHAIVLGKNALLLTQIADGKEWPERAKTQSI